MKKFLCFYPSKKMSRFIVIAPDVLSARKIAREKLLPPKKRHLLVERNLSTTAMT